MAMKQLENLSPPILRQVFPLVEQLPPLYMDLVKGRGNFTPKPEETRRLVCWILPQCILLVLKSGCPKCIPATSSADKVLLWYFAEPFDKVQG